MTESNSSGAGNGAPPFVIPVVDLLGGQVVRGMGGRRAEYRPIRSALCSSSDPLAVCAAFRAEYGLETVYVADLDAIAGAAAAIETYRRLMDAGFTLLVDAGIRRAEDADALIAAGVDTIVAGLESLESPGQLGRLLERWGARILFSLDLKGGKPLAREDSAWGARDGGGVLERACAVGARRVLLLDLARVGMDGGTGTEALARQALARDEGLEVLIGGGIRGADDLWNARRLGVHGVLVATALHDRKIEAALLSRLADPDWLPG